MKAMSILSSIILTVGILGCGDSNNTDAQQSDADAAMQNKPQAESSVARDGASTTQPARSASTTRPAGDEKDDSRLYGEWVAKDVSAPMGEVKVKLVFKREGPVKILAWSDLPLVGQVRDKSAPYEIHENTIESEALRGGTSVNYHFNDQGNLVIEYKDGKTVTFHRP